MSETITVGLDLAKNVFQVHGADGRGELAQEGEARAAPGRLRRRCFYESLGNN